MDSIARWIAKSYPLAKKHIALNLHLHPRKSPETILIPIFRSDLGRVVHFDRVFYGINFRQNLCGYVHNRGPPQNHWFSTSKDDFGGTLVPLFSHTRLFPAHPISSDLIRIHLQLQNWFYGTFTDLYPNQLIIRTCKNHTKPIVFWLRF